MVSTSIPEAMRLWSAIEEFCREQGGWVVSVPGLRALRIECRKDSGIPAKLIAAGHNIRHVGSHTRISAGEFLPVNLIEIMMPGK
jgi:hypothetical protein